MLRKALLGLLVLLVLLCVGVIAFIAFSPPQRLKQVQEVAQRAVEGKSLLARRPPPRATPVPATPTPIPPPDTQPIARHLRVKPEDFPFRLSKRVDQPNGQMRITLDVRNESGHDWPVAYLTISSAYYPERTHYRLDDWKQGNVRSIDYVFPASQMRERLKDLRVEDVTSIPPTEALSAVSMGSGSSDRGSQEGALGLWMGLKHTLGVPPPPPEELASVLTQVSPEAAKELHRGTGLTINLDGLGEIDAALLPLEGATGPEREVRSVYNEAIKAADSALTSMKALGATLGQTPWKEAMDSNGPGATELDKVRKDLDAFQSKAVRVQQIEAQAPSQETQALTKSLEQISGTLVSYQEALERQVRAAQPGFQLVSSD